MTGSCKPHHRYILLDGEHRIEVIPDEGGGQRYAPQVYIADEDGSWWESLLPDGESYQSLRDARNACARNAEKEAVN